MKVLHKKRKTTSAINTVLKDLKSELIGKISTAQDTQSFEDIESLIQKEFIESARQLLEKQLSLYDVAEKKLSFEGNSYRCVLSHTKTYQSLVGPLKVERKLYRGKKDQKCLCPLESLSGIVEGFWTPKAAKMGVLYMTEMPSDKAKKLLGEVSLMQPSSSALDQLPKKMSRVIEQDQEGFSNKLRDCLSVPKEAACVVVSLDGVLIPTRCNRVLPSDSRYEEASCGTLFLIDKEGHCLRKRQYGRMPEYKKRTLKNQLEKDLDYILAARPDLNIVKIADGARDNWDYLSNLHPEGVDIIDFYHASEHLKKAFELVYGDKNLKATRSYAKYREILLKDANGISKVINHLSYLCRKNPSKRLLKTERNYFKNNKNRMVYSIFYDQHFPIGSGVIEAICKTLATQRLKCSGMRWSYEGGQAILTFRSLSHSQLFDKAWGIIANKYQHLVNAANDEGSLPLFNAA